MEKTISELTVYDLIGSDCDVWLSENKTFGFDLEIESEDEGSFKETGLHPKAAEGLADFCKRYLRTYERLNKEKN